MIRYDSKRFVTALKPAGTKSFRLAASKLFNEYGNNAQNINSNSLNILVADPGTRFVQVDQSGAEALIVAYEAPSGRLRELFSLGIKSHFYVCLLLFASEWKSGDPTIDYLRLTPTELAARPEWPDLCREMKLRQDLYATAKTCCHQANYGSAARKFQTTVLRLSRGTVRLTYDQAHHYLEFYHALFSEIRLWHQLLFAEVRQHRLLRNFLGHPRRFEELFNDSYLRDALSWIPQSTVGCITHEATIDMQNYIETTGKQRWDILNNKHDSYLLQVPIADVEEAKVKGIEFMARPLYNRRGELFSMKAEATVSDNWSMEMAV